MLDTETDEITNDKDLIDVRDIIARVEEMRDLIAEPEDEATDESDDEAEREELKTLVDLLADLKGNGGDHEWNSAWYPIILVKDSYFEDFAREEAESLDLVKSDARWPYTCINWEEAADELKNDYSTVDFNGTNYWYR